MAAADIAGSLMVLEYCESKIKGKPTLAKVPQSLSCFEQTIPISVTILNFSHSMFQDLQGCVCRIGWACFVL